VTEPDNSREYQEQPIRDSRRIDQAAVIGAQISFATFAEMEEVELVLVSD